MLVLKRDEKPDLTIPIADLAVVIVAHPQVTYSQAVLAELASAGAAFIVCRRNGMPAGMVLPFETHHAQCERFDAQAGISFGWKALST